MRLLPKMEEKEEQDWTMMQVPNGSGWPWRRKEKLEKMVATTQLRLALETEEVR